MCLPLAIAALGATAAGAAMSGLGAQQAANASNSARNADNAEYDAMVNQGRQTEQKFADQKYAQLNKTVQNANVSNQTAQQQQEASKLQTQYGQSVAGLPGMGAPIPGLITNNTGGTDTGAKVINSTFGGQQNNTNNYLQQQAGAKANIDALGNSNLLNQIFNQNTGNQISLFNNEEAGSNQALQTNLGLENRKAQMDQYNASTAGGGLSMLGSLFSGAGGMASKFATF